ncbi:MAG: transcriptional regulator [Firmicutes bacterium]|nr:transcriptional regulator [Bacillota bacterium]
MTAIENSDGGEIGLDIQHLTSFVHIAKSGSFTKTAEKLGYVQSSVSAHIGALEKELGIKLFHRISGKNVSLTSDGERLLPIADEIVTLAAKLTSSASPQYETLSVATIESLSNSRLKGLFQNYPAMYPNINLVMRYDSCSDNLTLLREGKVDVAIFLDQEMITPEFEVQIFSEERLSILASPDHPLAQKEVVSPSDFNHVDIVLTEKGCSYHDLFINYIHEHTITPRRIVEVNSITAITELVSNGQGITFLPEIAVAQKILDKKLLPLTLLGQNFNMFTQIATRKNENLSKAAKLFLNMSKSWSVYHK